MNYGKKSPQLWAAIENEEQRQQDTIELIASENNNYQRLNIINTNFKARSVSLKISDTWGNDKVNIFAFDAE